MLLRITVLGLTALLVSGCLPPVLQVASWTVSGVSYMFSGKGVGDHVLSLATEQDCATWRVLQGKRICVDYDKQYENGWAAVASTFKAPTSAPTDDPQGVATDLPVQVASVADDGALFDTATGGEVEGGVMIPEKQADQQGPLDDAALIAMVDKFDGVTPAAGPSEDLTPTVSQPEKSTATAVTKPALAAPVSIQDGADNGIYLVIGSFRSNQRAVKLQAQHKDMNTAIMQARISGKSLYRVLAGPIVKSELTVARQSLLKGGVRHSWAVRLCKATLTPTPCVSTVQQASLPR